MTGKEQVVTRSDTEMVEVSKEQLDFLRAQAAVAQCLVGRFMQEAGGDVSGPHLAEPEVWARLEELAPGVANARSEL